MTNLMVSMLRLSAAFTLYGVDQMEKSMKLLEGGEEMSKTLEGYEKTLNSFTDVLLREMDEKKKETLETVKKASEDVVHRTMEGMDILDPREVMKAGTDMIQKSSDVAAQWVSKAATAMEKAAESPAAEDQEEVPVPEE